MVPEARDEEATVSADGEAAAMVMEVVAVALCAGAPESLTTAVKLNVPVAVGVPEMTPLVEFSESPEGRLPEEIDHL